MVGGIFVAILITYSRIVRLGFYPVIVVSQVVPKISIAPLFIVWFGTGTMSSLMLAFLIAFFPMTINAAMGFESVDEDIHKMARSFMGSPWQIFWKIRLPNALPYIFGGMKISITLAVIGVIVSEFVASQEGIGYLIKLSSGLLDTPLMMAAITVLSIGRAGAVRHHCAGRRAGDLLAGADRRRRRRGWLTCSICTPPPRPCTSVSSMPR